MHDIISFYKTSISSHVYIRRIQTERERTTSQEKNLSLHQMKLWDY